MINSISQRTKVIIVVVLVLLVTIGVLFYFNSQKKVPATEPERYAAPSIGLVDPDNLMLTSFTQDDFSLVRNAMTYYIISKGGDGYKESLNIKSIDVPARDPGAPITIKATIVSSNKDVTFVVTEPIDGSDATFSVPVDNYTVSLKGND